MYTYTLVPNLSPNDPPMIVRSDGVTIPRDDGNTDYQAYLVWLAAQPQ
jgi:hypothetical protein